MRQGQIWDWKVVGYLFLAGLGSGMFMIATALWLGSSDVPALRGVALASILLVGAGTLLLIGDLGRKWRFWRVFLNPGSSLISIGSWIITAFMITGLLYVIVPVAGLAWVGMIFALGTATYTGVLLGVVKARPLWNTPLLPVLFLVSALSCGAALLLWLGEYAGFPSLGLARADTLLVAIEAFLIFLYLLIMSQSTVTAMASVRQVISGAWRVWFWIGTVACGLVLPLAILLATASPVLTAVGAVLELAGGVSLRYWVVRAGERALLPGETWGAGLI